MLPVVHIYIDRSEAETWNHDEIDNLQGKINTGEYSMSKVIIIGRRNDDRGFCSP